MRRGDQPVFGRALRSWRKRAGISGNKLGRSLGISGQFISEVERGHAGMSDRTLQRLLSQFPDFQADLDALAEASAVAEPKRRQWTPGRLTEAELTELERLAESARRAADELWSFIQRIRDRSVPRDRET